jgi:amidophosphoribosyltransferase
MARDAGAHKVYFASAAPPVRYANVYGIDMPAPDELVANGRSEDEIRAFIGADRLIYQKLEDLIASVHEGNPQINRVDASCFNGEYVTGDVTDEFLQGVAGERGDAAKQADSGSLDIAELSVYH